MTSICVENNGAYDISLGDIEQSFALKRIVDVIRKKKRLYPEKFIFAFRDILYISEMY